MLQLSLPATPAAMPRGLVEGVLAASVLLLGSSWLGSAVADTPLTAVGFSMGVNILLWMVFTAIDRLAGPFSERLGPELSSLCMAVSLFVVGICCFAAGCLIDVRRVGA